MTIITIGIRKTYTRYLHAQVEFFFVPNYGDHFNIALNDTQPHLLQANHNCCNTQTEEQLGCPLTHWGQDKMAAILQTVL